MFIGGESADRTCEVKIWAVSLGAGESHVCPRRSYGEVMQDEVALDSRVQPGR